MRVKATKHRVVLDGSGTLLLTNNEEGITVDTRSGRSNIPVTIENFLIWNGTRREKLNGAIGFMGYNKIQVKMLRFLTWLFR